MQRTYADNARNESQITFVSDARDDYATQDDFYAAAIRLLWAGWDSEDNTEKYIARANKVERTLSDLQTVVTECLQITPVADFTPVFVGVESVHSFRDDWNVREYMWCSTNAYWLMSWDTSA
jgi:hypothetical protein